MNVWKLNQFVWSGLVGVLGIATLACGSLQAQPADNVTAWTQQQADPPEQRERQPAAVTVQGGASVVRAQGFGGVVHRNDAGMGRMQDQVRRATEALRNAENVEQKTRAMQQLTGVLNEYFDSDLQRRADELAQIEERVKNLREQLDRRREKKQEIIDLQIKVAQNEADGLGFFGTAGGVSTFGSVSGSGFGGTTAVGVAVPMEVSPERRPEGPRPVERPIPPGARRGAGADRQPGPPPGDRDPFGPGTRPVNPPEPAGPPR